MTLQQLNRLLEYTDDYKRNRIDWIRVLGTKLRDKPAEFLKTKGVSAGIHYPIPIHLQEAYRDLGYKKGNFPVIET